MPPPAQVVALPQLPQLVTERLAPQLSTAVNEPQFLPKRLQKVASLSGVQLLLSKNCSSASWVMLSIPLRASTLKRSCL